MVIYKKSVEHSCSLIVAWNQWRNTMEWQMNAKSERKKIEEDEITTRKSEGNT